MSHCEETRTDPYRNASLAIKANVATAGQRFPSGALNTVTRFCHQCVLNTKMHKGVTKWIEFHASVSEEEFEACVTFL